MIQSVNFQSPLLTQPTILPSNRHQSSRVQDTAKTNQIAQKKFDLNVSTPVISIKDRSKIIAEKGIWSATVEKIYSCGQSWGLWVAIKTPRIFVFRAVEDPQIKNAMNHEIYKLSGSNGLSTAIHSASPVIADLIQRILSSCSFHKSLNNESYLKKEHQRLHLLIETLLPEIYVNIAKYIQDNDNSGLKKRPIKLLDITRWFLDVVETQLPNIHAEFDRLSLIEDPDRRQRKLCALFMPLSDALFKVALPNGYRNLPFRKIPWLSEKIWGSVKDSYFPLICVEIYQQLLSPKKEEKRELLQKIPGGESLISLSELAGKKTGENFAKVISRDNPIILATLSELFESCFTGSIEMKKELGHWLTHQVVELCNSEHPSLKNLRMFIGSFVEPFLMHMLDRLAEREDHSLGDKPGFVPDARGSILVKLFMLSSRFFNSNSSEIEQYIQTKKENNEVIDEKDPYLRSIFNGFTNDLLKAMGLDRPETFPVPECLKEKIHGYTKAIASEIILKEYLGFKKNDLGESVLHNKLQSVLFDSNKLKNSDIATTVISALHGEGDQLKSTMFTAFYNHLWKESGTKSIVEIIELMCKISVKDIVSMMFNTIGVSSQPTLDDTVNPFMKYTHDYIDALVETVLTEILINMLETTPQMPLSDEKHPKQLFLFQFVLRFSGMVKKDLKDIESKIAHATQQYGELSPEYQQQVHECFMQFADSLYSLGGAQALNHLPLEELPAANNIKQLLSDSIKDVLLPSSVAAIYSILTSWQRERGSSIAALESHYHTTHIYWASHVVAQYVSDWIRNYLANSSDKVSQTVIDLLVHYFSSSEHPGSQKLAKLLAVPFCDVKALLIENLSSLGKSDAPEALEIWPAITSYLEGIILKFVSSLTKSINDVEIKNPDFMKDLAITMLKDVEDYLDSLNRMKDSVGSPKRGNVNPIDALEIHSLEGSDFLDEYTFLNAKTTPEEKDAIRLKKYFVPLVSKFFLLANISPTDFPVPSQLQGIVGELVIKHLVPNIMLQAYSKILEHPVRDSLTLNFIEALHNALNGVKSIGKVQEKKEAIENPDAKQIHLKERCKGLVSKSIRLLDDPLVQYISSNDKVKNIAAEVISDAMDKYLSKWTLIQLVDNVVFNGLPKFHSSFWKGKTGREVLIPLNCYLGADDKMISQMGKKFGFSFPTTAAEMLAEKILKKQEADETRTFLRNGFTTVISSQLIVNSWSFTKAAWALFQNHLDDFIKIRFPESGPKLKGVLDRIFHKVFFDFIGGVCEFIFYPLNRVLKYSVEKVYIDRKSNDIIRNIHSDDLEILVHKCTNSLIDTLLSLRQPFPG